MDVLRNVNVDCGRFYTQYSARGNDDIGSRDAPGQRKARRV